MRQWKRACALAMSVLTMSTTILGTGCEDLLNIGKGSDSSGGVHSHVWLVNDIITATCTEKGLKRKICEICEKEEYEQTEAGHSIVKYVAQAPTCKTVGWDAYEVCENCNYTTQEIQNALGHNYVEGQCTTCGEYEKTNCEHSWGSYEIITNATCLEGGLKARECENCDEVEFATIPAGHTLVYDEGSASTCTSDGWTSGYYCEKCDYNETEIIPEKSHNYVNDECINGCGIEKPKATLSIATFGGGIGKAWLEDAIARFEEKYATATYFEEGTKGVEIDLDADTAKYAGSRLAKDAALKKDIYFTEGVEYYTLVNQGKVADITDVVTGSMSAYGESGTIEDKLDGTVKDFMTAKDGKYYMLPFYDGYYGLTYDVELFETEGFYFDKNGNFTKDKTKFSNGPDGQPSTYDDGLPATYDQMIKLCDEITAKGFIPFCYSGNTTDYVNRTFYSWMADYEGYDAFSLNKNFNGTAKLAKSITPGVGTMEATIEFENVAITEENAYELQRQAGRYYALAMEEALFGSTKYIGGRFNSLDYTVAQAEFIKGKYSRMRYAMLAEGVWWENEASSTFVETKNTKNEGKMDRKFGFMPIPKVNAAAAAQQTMFSQNSSFGFINKDCENMELAKEFMRFLHTDAEMSKFTAKTSIPRSLEYEVSAEDRASTSYYGQSVMDMRNNAKVVYPFSATNIIVKNPAIFENNAWFGTTYFKSTHTIKNNAFDVFKNDQATALEYYNGMHYYQWGIWSGLER